MSAGDSPQSRLAAPLALLWRKHYGTILERVAVLEHAVDGLRLDSAISSSEQLLVESAAHKLAGTLGTFGSPRGSEIAEHIERLFSPDMVVDEQVIIQAGPLISELRAVVLGLALAYDSTTT